MSTSLTSGKAYKLYRQEFARFLESARGALRSPEITAETAEEMKRNFHKLRGSSGFFGLKGAEKLSEELEKMFSAELDRVAANLEQARKAVDALNAEFRSLEIPGAGVSLRKD